MMQAHVVHKDRHKSGLKVKGREMMSDANNTQRKAGASTLISNEIYFNSKK
jgi:carbonic anhydrase